MKSALARYCKLRGATPLLGALRQLHGSRFPTMCVAQLLEMVPKALFGVIIDWSMLEPGVGEAMAGNDKVVPGILPGCGVDECGVKRR